MLPPPRRRTGPRYLPASVYRAVAAGGAVDLPAGEFRLGSPLATTRAVQLTASQGRCWLTPDGWTALRLTSPVVPYLVASQGTRNESKLTGTVTADTDTLTLAEPAAGLAVGEVVQIALGVNLDDPAEYAVTPITRTVASVAGGAVSFTQALGVDVPTYTDSELRGHFPGGENGPTGFWGEKIGPWGQWRGDTGQYRKGYGDTHGMIRFGAGGLNAGSSVSGVGFRQPNSDPRRRPFGPPVIDCQHLAGLTLTGITADGAAGPLVQLVACDGSEVGGTSVTGDAYSRYGDTQYTRCPVVLLFGGTGNAIRNTTIRGRNWQYVHTEVTPRNLTLDTADIDSPASGLTQEVGQLYVTGGAPGLAASGIVVRGGLPVYAPDRSPPLTPRQPISNGAVTQLAS